MYWVDDDDDPCDCCGSPHHSWHACPVARQRMEEDRKRQDRIIFGFEKPEVSYIPFSHRQQHYPNSQGYYQVNNRYLGNSSAKGGHNTNIIGKNTTSLTSIMVLNTILYRNKGL